MEKKEFISQLRDELLKRGFRSETVEAEMIPVASYFDENGMNDIEVSVNDMADEISEMLKEKGEEPAENTEPDVQEFEDIESALKASADVAPKAETDSGKKGKKGKKSEEKPAVDTPAETENTVIAAACEEESDDDVKIAAPFSANKVAKEAEEDTAVEITDEELEQYRPGEKKDDVKTAGFIGKLIVKIKGAAKKSSESVDEYESNAQADDYEDKKFRIIFWILFAIALPFLITLSALMIFIYIAFWVALALVMIVLIAGLIAFVFAGVTVALVGIIYGVIMIIKGSAPVGLFEIGLGITVGAVVMFAGILVYNFAIRLIPFAMKLLAKLLGLAFRRGKEGLGAIRRLLQDV